MKQLLLALSFCLLAPLAHAWNAAGHRLTAMIAWQQMSPTSREQISAILAHHPDYARWLEKAKTPDGAAIFCEAATWPDDIRNDPRYQDEVSDSGQRDSSRHKDWHYVDLAPDGSVSSGQLERQIELLSRLLRSTANKAQISYALPWLIHLVADIHQPLHVGRHGDEGGNRVEIENPFNKRLPFSSLHTYWDDLPGPPWLRGKRLEQKTAALMDRYATPVQARVRVWRDESHRLLAYAYPKAEGSLLPVITEEFNQQSREIAERRIVEAGYRLGRLLEEILGTGVSRGTP